jgi:hypothetical protein
MLEDLPDLSDLQSPSHPPYIGASMLPEAEVERYKKFIRGGHVPPSESGMFPRPPPPPPPPNMIDQDITPYTSNTDDIKSKYGLSNSPSCLEVADHIANCPICSKFYNTDKTMHIVIIVLLAIICIILLKKILNV